jgi:3-phosphoshikimate 1-carboxyvinyltransferase
VVLTGASRMKQRPIKGLVDALCSLGADIEFFE